MQTLPIFSVGIGITNVNSLLPTAKILFKDNKNYLLLGENNLKTTLNTYNSKNNCAFLNNQEAVEIIKKSIINNAKLYYQDIGFQIDVLNFEVINLWLNEMDENAMQKTHCHYGYQVSGCFYIDVPEGSNFIKFYQGYKIGEHGVNIINNYNQFNAQYFIKEVNAGDMLFWESLLMHEVPKLKFNGTRRSIAFDLQISIKQNRT